MNNIIFKDLRYYRQFIIFFNQRVPSEIALHIPGSRPRYKFNLKLLLGKLFYHVMMGAHVKL